MIANETGNDSCLAVLYFKDSVASLQVCGTEHVVLQRSKKSKTWCRVRFLRPRLLPIVYMNRLQIQLNLLGYIISRDAAYRLLPLYEKNNC